MKALTLHAPWAHAVAWLGKPLENRSWVPPLSIVGERIAIHAGLSDSQIEWRRIDLILAKMTATMPDAPVARGALVCTAIVGSPVTESDSPWFIPGNFGWPLIDVRRLPDPIPCKGRLGLWTLPEAVSARLETP